MPVWQGAQHIRTPFNAWGSTNAGLPWFQGYNAAKHDRHGNFKLANFENLVDSIAGLVVLLSSQFFSENFSPSRGYHFVEASPDGFENAVGDYFQVKYPVKSNAYALIWSIRKSYKQL